MGSRAVELDEEALEAARRRAAEEGLTVGAFVSDLVRRATERRAGEDGILAYDHVSVAGPLVLDREPGEGDESNARRHALYGDLFGRKE